MAALIVRGIYLSRRSELDFTYKEGASRESPLDRADGRHLPRDLVAEIGVPKLTTGSPSSRISLRRSAGTSWPRTTAA